MKKKLYMLQRKYLSSRNVIAGSIGNLLEWYDFSLYGYFASTIGMLFFPPESDAGLLKAFSIFAIGLLVRPIGGLILGHFGDSLGRRFALFLSIILITLPTFFMGLLPTYAQAGANATIFLIILRILQGLSVGGEFIGTTVFLVEHAPDRKRGIGGSFAYMGQTGGMLFSAVAVALTSKLSQQDFLSWGWRVPFLIGILVGAFGFILRRKVFETPPFCRLHNKKQICKTPLKEILHNHGREIFLVAGLVFFQSISFYLLLLYSVTWMTSYAGFSSKDAIFLNIFMILLFTALMPIAGKLSDTKGRKPFLLVATVGMAILSLPLFYGISASSATQHPVGYSLIFFSLFAILLASWHGPLATVLVEITHLRYRYTSLALGYNLSAAIFGGTAPLIATFLYQKSNWTYAPWCYLTVAATLAACIVYFFYKETYRRSIND